jgi:hypothetical protein
MSLCTSARVGLQTCVRPPACLPACLPARAQISRRILGGGGRRITRVLRCARAVQGSCGKRRATALGHGNGTHASVVRRGGLRRDGAGYDVQRLGQAGGDDIGEDILSDPLPATREPYAVHFGVGSANDVGLCVADHPGTTR